MWLPKGNTTKKGTGNGLVAVAIDKDKGSQNALKWTLENLAIKGQTIVLIHVILKPHSASGNGDIDEGTLQQKLQAEKQTRDLFVSFHCYCTRKDIHCLDIVLEDVDRVKAIAEYVSMSAIEILVLGAPSRNSFIRRFKTDVPTSVSKAAPDFCTVYVISKGKISSVRNASRPAPYNSPLLSEIEHHNSTASEERSKKNLSFAEMTPLIRPRKSVESDIVRSPFVKRTGQGRTPGDLVDSHTDISFISSSRPDTDISFISSGRPSTDHSSFVCDLPESGRTSRISTSSDQSMGSFHLGIKFNDSSFLNEFSSVSQESSRTSCSFTSQSLEEAEAEMKKLRLELKQTMDLYSTACKEALSARQQATELQRWRNEEERRWEEAKLSEEAAMSIVEKERSKAKAATEAAEAAKRLAEMEAKRRVAVEMKALREADEMKEVFNSFSNGIVRYRRYTVEEIEAATENFSKAHKVGEGGYGPVYKCYLDHTHVAVKVLRPDAAQGRSQFQKEVEVLSCIRHPNMVLLLGACPEYGILVYEYMAKGSLEDRLFQRGNTPPLTWQLRFRIAAEIATGLLFLHQTKPEPIVHRDLKPANILLDLNYVSKISDVGLARLVPAVAENVTQYRVTSAAGTFCYIDPEYQQTGMLGVKSDVYSLGIMLLQLLTGKEPMGLAYYAQEAIEEGTFKDMLDPDVPDWPVEEALSLGKLALRCGELRRKDRPDLGKEVLPELNRLRALADESTEMYYVGPGKSPNPSQVSITMETRSDPHVANPESPKPVSNLSLETEEQSETTEEEG